MQLAALLLCIIAQSDAKPRGIGPAGRDYILSVLPEADTIGTLSESTIEVPAATDGSTLAQQVRALDAQAARRIQERDARQAARKARETQRAVARTFNALSEEPVLAPVADEDEDEDEEVVVEEPVPTETRCVLCREAKLGKQGCAALLRLASRQGVVTEMAVADSRIEGGLEVLLEWALCRGGRRLRIKRDACGHCDLAKLKKTNTTASLEILELEHLQLEDISGLADLLTPHSTTLKRLSLRGNARICDAGVVALAKFVRTASVLEVLDLRNTGCSDGGTVALARALKARRENGLPNVAVDVGENLLSARGANDLMKECEVLDLRRNDLQGARLSLKNAPHLRQLSLASCAFTPLDGEDFLKAASKSSIEVLDLSGNALTTVEACVEINQ